MGFPVALRASLLVSVVTVAVGAVQTAEACTCVRDRSWLVVPTEDAPLPAGSPLLLYVNEESIADTLLVDGGGENLALTPELVLPGLGLCASSVVVLRPSAPLTSGETYTVRPADPRTSGALYTTEKSRSFRVSSTAVEFRTRTFTVSTVEEHIASFVSSSASCADPMHDGQLVTSYATITVQADAPALFLLAVTIDDPGVGRYSDVDPSLGAAEGADWEFELHDSAMVKVPLLERSSRCLGVEVYDWTGALLVTEAACVEPGEVRDRVHSVKVAVSPLESGASYDDGDASGCGCAIPQNPTSKGWWAWLLLALFVRRGRGPRPAWGSREKGARIALTHVAVVAPFLLIGCGGSTAQEGEQPQSPFLEDELVCDDGYADCDGDPDTGCESDLQSAAACGECGHSCGVAACVAGHCSDLVPEDVATNVPGYELTVVGDSLYWATSGDPSIARFDPGTGATETVVEIEGRAIAIGVDSAYVATSTTSLASEIVRIEFVDGTTSAVPTQHSAGDGTLAGEYLFWVADPNLMKNEAPYFVHALPVTGGASTTLAEVNASTVVATDAVVCWNNPRSARVACAQHDGTPVGEWTTQEGAFSLGVDANAVYWCDSAGLARAPLDGGAVETFGDASCRQIVPDGDAVYYLAHSHVVRLTLVTGQTEVLAAVSEPYELGGLALLGDHVYWLDGGRDTLSRVPR